MAGLYAVRGAVRLSALCAAALLAACGARSPLGLGVGSSVDAGGASSGGSAGAPGGGAGGAPAKDASTDHPDAVPGCSLDDLSTWRTERFRAQGDYERPVAALAGVPWIALKLKGGNVVLEKLGVDAHGIVVEHSIEVPDSPVYPAGLDVDARRFVLLTTTGQNWNGDAELWRIDRADGGIVHVPVGTTTDPAYVIYSTLGLAGDDVVLAYASANTQGNVELRNDALDVIQSMPVESSSFQGVRSGNAVDVYLGNTKGRVHAEGGTLTQSPVDPDWQVVGGLDGFLVETGLEIRLSDGTQTWDADWPHTQISPPAVVRTNQSHVAFSLETELTGVVGYVAGGNLHWLRIEGTSDAPGTGLALMPVVEQGRLGLFYLGLEIPHPEQPLRYYGLVCP